jgi:ribonuclease VapC
VDIIAKADRCLVSVLSIYETAIVLLLRRGMGAVDQLFEYMDFVGAEPIRFDSAQAQAAINAYAVCKAIHPKARLNLCDCAAYALAKQLNAPLLYKGFDFSHTDIRACE